MSYFYLYDSYLQDRGYANTLIKLETTLADLGIPGRVGRLTLLKSVKDLVETAIRDGADTVVAVGNDITLSQVVQAVVKQPKITLGFIPLGSSHQTIAPLLGIPVGLLACHVLSGRIVTELPVGKINNQYWLQSIVVRGAPVLECEHSYEITLERPHTVRICNLDPTGKNLGLSAVSGKLVAVITPTESVGFNLFKKQPPPTSTLPLRELTLSSTAEELPVVVDNYRTLKTPVNITLAPQQIRIIVGKKRLI